MRHAIGENHERPHDCTVCLWTTVENRGITIWGLTCGNRVASPIHRTYNDYTRN